MKPFARIASLIFALVALIHLSRVLFKTNVFIDSYELPMWVSIAGFIITIVLSVGLWRESK